MQRANRPHRLGKNSYREERNLAQRDGKGYRGERSEYHEEYRHSRRAEQGRGYRHEYRDEHRPQDYQSEKRHSFRRPEHQVSTMSSTQQSIKPIPIDLKPSGILTKYLHLQQNPVGNDNAGLKESGSKYAPPDDAVVPTAQNCPFHLFKYNDDTKKQVEVPIFNFKSYFLFGRDSELCDIVIDKDTEDGDLVSKQHAVLQFKKSKKVPDRVDCFIMDMGSTNGTFLNDSDVELPSKRYIQLKNKDFIRFGDYDAVVEFMIVEDKP